MSSSLVESGLLSNLQWIIKEESIMKIEGGGSQFNRKYTIQPLDNQMLYLFNDESVRSDLSSCGSRLITVAASCVTGQTKF